jgi:hypothetical protein
MSQQQGRGGGRGQPRGGASNHLIHFIYSIYLLEEDSGIFIFSKIKSLIVKMCFVNKEVDVVPQLYHHGSVINVPLDMKSKTLGGLMK